MPIFQSKRKTLRRIPIAVLAMLTSIGSHAETQQHPYNMSTGGIVNYQDVFHPVVAENGMVSSQNRIATEVGVEILKQGGNAIDASVAVGLALAVTLPRAGNLGGGGFMVYHQAKDRQNYAIDYRETAPTGVMAEDFLHPDGTKNRASALSWDAAGVPGTVAGMHRAWKQFGSGNLSWEALVEPALKLARDGFEVNYDLAQIIESKRERMIANKAIMQVFYKADGSAYRQGDLFKQPDLAWTLQQIAKHGPKAFYEGEIADKIVADMQRHGGHIDHDDLRTYEVKVKQPVLGEYRDHQLIAMPPPSSGGVTILGMLNILEQFPIGDWGVGSDSIHVMIEAMKFAFADRGTHMADPDFYPVPVNWLIDKPRAKRLASQIKLNQSIDATKLKGDKLPKEGPSTTHYSIVDKEGNAVSNTYTLGYSFGNAKVVAGTGIVLNNQIHTFSVRAGIKDATGFIASKANKLEAGKRPVSSQSPIIVLKDNKPFLITGSPGGSKIINVVIQMIVNSIDHQMNVAEATKERRIHHQWIPDELQVEPGFNRDTITLLRQKGQTVRETSTMGSSQSIMIKDGYIYGASDPRRPNALTLGY